ncbi:RHS repeat domain-containing protein [uncultured Thiodictyon sp.]|jgi:YD repeat-containing protein|uniref:RHS repeat domain-containing protein n=1 Tax=uncultured Thiodictyon sp. TaxID=1846217 RepID=UPI0025E39D23|nr:RHS repeat domain-containing protein [uncultured Thiodictyon sp.]
MGLILVSLAGPVWAGSAAYTYDTLGRLTRVAYTNGAVIAYVYDAAGNRSSMAVTGAAAVAMKAAVPAPATTQRASPSATATATGTVEAATGPVRLPAGGEDPGIYGWNDRSEHLERALTATFMGDGHDRLLHVQGYAIDAADEVGLWLNGTLLGYLSEARDGTWGTPSLWLLPAALQIPAENAVTLAPRDASAVWGVTRLGLYAFGSVWGNQYGLPGGDLTHPDGIELHLGSDGPGQAAGYLIELAGWDTNSDGEIAITLDDEPLVDLPRGGDRIWGTPSHLWLAPDRLAPGDHRLLITNRFGPLEPWGLRIDRVLPGDTALGDGLPDQATAQQRHDALSVLLPPTKVPTELDLRFFDVTYGNELRVRLDGALQAPVALTGAGAWGLPWAIPLPAGLPAVLSVEHAGNSTNRAVWGLRIDGWR